MLFGSVRAIIVPLSVLLVLLFGMALPAQSQGHLVLTAFPSILSDGNFTYPVAVQLQDGAGRPAFPTQKITIQLSSSDANVIQIYENATVGYARKQVTLEPPNPTRSQPGNTFVVFDIRAAKRDINGAATITASAPGYSPASASVTTFAAPKQWPPAQKISITFFPPIVAAGEEPWILIQPYDANNRQTFHRSGEIEYKMTSSAPAVLPTVNVVSSTIDNTHGGHRQVQHGRAVAPGQAQITLLPQGTTVKGSGALLTVVPRPASVGPDNTIVTPPPPPAPPPNPDTKTVDLSKDIVINSGEVWEGDIPASSVLDLQARLNYAKPAGSNFALDISVNGHRVESPLLNKAAQYKYQDGRTFPYSDMAKGGWMVFYSPDFSANNSAAGGGYQVLTDPGEAYHYRWNVSAFAGGGKTMHVRIRHGNPGAVGPLVIRIGR
jgi:hypothetical protein